MGHTRAWWYSLVAVYECSCLVGWQGVNCNFPAASTVPDSPGTTTPSSESLSDPAADGQAAREEDDPPGAGCSVAAELQKVFPGLAMPDVPPPHGQAAESTAAAAGGGRIRWKANLQIGGDDVVSFRSPVSGRVESCPVIARRDVEPRLLISFHPVRSCLSMLAIPWSTGNADIYM